jgi:ATP synthase protein I
VAQDPTVHPAEPPEADASLDSLEQRIARTRAAEDVRLGLEDGSKLNAGRAVGMHIASTMLGYPLGGIVVGWFLDGLFGTRPWIMIVLMFAAFAAACLQVVRSGNLRAE